MITRFSRSTATTILRIAIGSLLLLSAACSSDSPTEPTVNVPYSQTDLVVGTGTEAVNGSGVTVSYTLWLYAATSAENKGAFIQSLVGYQYNVGRGDVIAGWEQGVPGMRVGGQRRLIIPPALGFGSVPSGPIPANSTLVFDVTLLGVQ